MRITYGCLLKRNNMAWYIYLMYLIETLKNLFCVIGGISIAGLLIWGLFCLLEDAPLPKKWMFIVSSCILFIGVILPSKSILYTMVGVELAEKVVTSEPVKDITDDTLDIITLYLEKVKTELENENSNARTSN